MNDDSKKCYIGIGIILYGIISLIIVGRGVAICLLLMLSTDYAHFDYALVSTLLFYLTFAVMTHIVLNRLRTKYHV